MAYQNNKHVTKSSSVKLHLTDVRFDLSDLAEDIRNGVSKKRLLSAIKHMKDSFILLEKCAGFLDCRAYVIRIYEKKSGRYYRFSVLAESKPVAVRMVEDYCKEAIGFSCKIKKITKLPNKPQVIDYSED